MIQISFQPALDPYHTMFRLLRVMPCIAQVGALPNDHVRIMDFYLAFPFRISQMQMRQDHRKFRKLGKKYASKRPYGDQPEGIIVLERMKLIQDTAAQSLSTWGLLSPDRLSFGWIEPQSSELPSAVAERISEINNRESDLMEFMYVLASDYSLSGVGGLKQRTGLMEYRYDAA